MGLVENLIIFLTVQRLWKSVHIWQVITDYVTFCFCGPQCILGNAQFSCGCDLSKRFCRFVNHRWPGYKAEYCILCLLMRKLSAYGN